MLIVHDADLNLRHIIYEHPENYHEILEAEGAMWVRHPHSLPMDHIQLSRHPETNEVQVAGAPPAQFTTTLSAPKIEAGGVVTLTAIPEGTQITVNGATLGVMDDSQTLEFTAENAGFYTIKLTKRGYATKEFTLEADIGC